MLTGQPSTSNTNTKGNPNVMFMSIAPPSTETKLMVTQAIRYLIVVEKFAT